MSCFLQPDALTPPVLCSSSALPHLPTSHVRPSPRHPPDGAFQLSAGRLPAKGETPTHTYGKPVLPENLDLTGVCWCVLDLQPSGCVHQTWSRPSHLLTERPQGKTYSSHASALTHATNLMTKENDMEGCYSAFEWTHNKLVKLTRRSPLQLTDPFRPILRVSVLRPSCPAAIP